jgi:hypothetical protein
VPQKDVAHARPFRGADLCTRAEDGHTAESEGLIVRAERFGEKDGGVGARLQVAGVLGELGKKEQRPPLVVNGQRDERPIRKAGGVAGDGRQRRRPRLRGKGAAAFCVGRSRGVWSGLLLSGRRPPVIAAHGNEP